MDESDKSGNTELFVKSLHYREIEAERSC